MTITEEQLAELELLYSEATKCGSWEAWLGTGGSSVRTGLEPIVDHGHVSACDAVLIAAARNALPRLIAAIREARADEQRWRARVHLLEAREQMAVDVLSGKVVGV